ncbi:MAG: prepilin-type N-terminal cleavage/methylation domain-containing protein [Planctomycetes bacterium]|nr:prepilin-type N-terminal cleavage/methylation domain-containing protein [Planctomycetota bacterium]
MNDALRQDSDRQRAQRGFTLLELLTVLALISVLMGIGVGAFRKLNPGRAMAVAQVKDALRSARLFALEQSVTSRVLLDATENVIAASGIVAVGDWHFETEDGRGWPVNARFDGGASVQPDGAIGRCVVFPPSDPGTVRLGRGPAFDFVAGMRIEAFVRVGTEAAGNIVSKGEAFVLAIGPGRTLKGSVLVSGRKSGETAEPLVVASTEPLPVDRWVRVGLAHDGRSLKLWQNGVEVASVDDQEKRSPMPATDAEILLGSVRPTFVGAIDEVKIGSFVTQQAPPLPEGVRLSAGGDVWFDARGRLDSRFHTKPVTITLVYDEESRMREITVSLLGEIQ